MKKLLACLAFLLLLAQVCGGAPPAELVLPLGVALAGNGPTGVAGPGGGVGPAAELPIGCTSAPGETVADGPEGGRAVALTFDDGPRPTQTVPILATLQQLHAKATFFEEGRHVAGNEALMQEILAAGGEIGNHSYDHPKYPDATELDETDRLIQAATGFQPCLFRPPYGLLDTAVSAEAASAGLETILWSFDSGDDHHRGVRVLEANAVHRSRPGAIILMHDGGHHPQTVTALPGIIEGLRARHFRLVTVTELLGGHFIYR